MRRVTYDSNIWISALQFGGRMRAVLQMAIDKEIEVAISEPIVQETLRILRDKFGWSDGRLQGAEATMNLHATKVTPTQALNVVPGDADDNRIIECAVASGSEAIVTGDKDLLRMGSYQGIKMIRAGGLLGRGR